MIDTSTFTLPNGLRIVHHADNYTPMVALDILYDVGARDEDPQHTGIAHLLEHMMFGGSANFYSVAPAANAETLFWLESDRMLAPAFSPETFEVQRNVVLEEFKQTCLNQPYGNLGHLLR